MDKNLYTYFISFTAFTTLGRPCGGNGFFELDFRLDSNPHLLKVQELIERQKRMQNVCVINFILVENTE